MRKKILKILFSNFGYKISSLLLAIIIWGIIQGEQVLEITREITISVRTPEGMIIRGPETRVRGAIIKGPRVLMLEIPDRIEASVTIPKNITGGYRIRLTKLHFEEIDDRLNLTIDDPYLDFFVDHKMTRTVPIKELLVGVPADGHIITKVSSNPKYVRVTGLKSEVLKLKNLPTEPIDISGIKKSFQTDINLIPQPGKKFTYSESTAKISIEVGEQKINKIYSRIPLEIVGSEYISSTKPVFVSVTIQGTPATIKDIKKSDLQAFIEVTGLKPGKYQKDIKVKIPSNTALIETSPEQASVAVSTIKKKGS